MSAWAAYIGIFACAFVIEVGWIAAVRAVTVDRTWAVVANAAFMQGVSNVSTLILISDKWTAVSSCLGAAAGAFFGMYRLMGIFSGRSRRSGPILPKTTPDEVLSHP